MRAPEEVWAASIHGPERCWLIRQVASDADPWDPWGEPYVVVHERTLVTSEGRRTDLTRPPHGYFASRVAAVDRCRHLLREALGRQAEWWRGRIEREDAQMRATLERLEREG
jgi:hypothetical protein